MTFVKFSAPNCPTLSARNIVSTQSISLLAVLHFSSWQCPTIFAFWLCARDSMISSTIKNLNILFLKSSHIVLNYIGRFNKEIFTKGHHDQINLTEILHFKTTILGTIKPWSFPLLKEFSIRGGTCMSDGVALGSNQSLWAEILNIASVDFLHPDPKRQYFQNILDFDFSSDFCQGKLRLGAVFDSPPLYV